MDFFVVVQALLRRWWVVVPVLALTAAGVFVIMSQAEPTYEARASVLLTSLQPVQAAPPDQADQTASDATIIAEIVQGDGVRSRLREQNAVASYTVEVAAEGAILRVRAQDANPGSVVPTVDAVLTAITDTVGQRRGSGEGAGGAPAVEILASPSEERATTVTDADGQPQAVYEATGAVALRGSIAGSNPYGANNATLRVLEERASSPEVQADIAREGRGSTFDIGMENRDAAPIMYVTAIGTDAEGVMNSLHGALGYLNDELAQRQDAVGAPPDTRLRLEPLAMPVGATALAAELRRPLLTVVGLGLVAAVSLAILVDNFVAYRRARAPRSGFELASKRTGPEQPAGAGHVEGTGTGPVPATGEPAERVRSG